MKTPSHIVGQDTFNFCKPSFFGYKTMAKDNWAACNIGIIIKAKCLRSILISDEQRSFIDEVPKCLRSIWYIVRKVLHKHDTTETYPDQWWAKIGEKEGMISTDTFDKGLQTSTNTENNIEQQAVMIDEFSFKQ